MKLSSLIAATLAAVTTAALSWGPIAVLGGIVATALDIS
jgi:hypothetical protein